MRSLTDIKHRMKSVAQTKQITGAMETISVAKMRKSLARAENNRLYFERVRETIADIVNHTNSYDSRYMMPPKGERCVFVVVASDKGLAGGFNHNVLGEAYKRITQCDCKSVFAVGQVTREFFEKKGIMCDVEFADAGYDPTMRDAGEISRAVKRLFDSKMVDEAYLVYTKPLNSTVMAPDVIKLLPLNKDVMTKENALSVEDEYALQEIEYDPSPDEVLSELIPQYLTGVIYGALLQSAAGEHSARRAAMSNATKNATDILDELSIDYNRARQEAVTGELSEIITAASAVEKHRR